MKKIGIGYENYKDFIDNNMYYVDKTMIIRDITGGGGKVTLFTRPRRFGKTLALSMIRTFFELEYDSDGNVVDNRRYFEGMKIMGVGDDIVSRMGQYPVIKLSLKSAKQPDFYTAFIKLADEIQGEFSRHLYLQGSNELNDYDRSVFNEIARGRTEWIESEKNFKTSEDRTEAFGIMRAKYATALKTLSECLYKHHRKKTIILIDEYDVPLENAYTRGFYQEMIDFIRSLFESALKTNDALEFGVVTGCLRISKESIFTGLNNLNVNSIRGTKFGEYFGFLQEETEAMLSAYGLSQKVDEVKEWYDGYLFGESEVYNPWSVIKYVYDHKDKPDRFPEPYWANTSSNSIIKEMVDGSSADIRRELDDLIAGGTIEKKIHEDITYDDVHKSEENLWNFLFFTGYMKKVSERQVEEDIYVTMKIPNREIRSIYRNQISDWFSDIVKNTDQTDLYKAIMDMDTGAIETILSRQFEKAISTFDSAESFYHGYVLSMLYNMPHYSARSNREEGDDRPDVTLYPDRPRDPAYIFEFKTRKKFNEMQDGLQEAFDQIRDKKYEEGVLDEGYAGVVSFGICFCKKSCVVGLYSIKCS